MVSVALHGKGNRYKGNLITDFRYLDLTEVERNDVLRLMEKYNNQGGNAPAGLQAKYSDPGKFYEQVIKKYGWGLKNA